MGRMMIELEMVKPSKTRLSLGLVVNLKVLMVPFTN